MNTSRQRCAVSTVSRGLLPLVVIAFAVLVTKSAVAQVANTLTLEETSSATLTATYSPAPGFPTSTTFTVTPGAAPDNWFVSSPNLQLTTTGNTWIEPDNPFSYNRLAIPPNASAPNILSVTSDVIGQGNLADESAFAVGIDLGNGQPINVVFDDDAATAEAPDTGSTLGLFFLSLTALFGASRFRSVHLA